MTQRIDEVAQNLSDLFQLNGREFFPDTKFSVGESGSACLDRPTGSNTFTDSELQRMDLMVRPKKAVI